MKKRCMQIGSGSNLKGIEIELTLKACTFDIMSMERGRVLPQHPSLILVKKKKGRCLFGQVVHVHTLIGQLKITEYKRIIV